MKIYSACWVKLFFNGVTTVVQSVTSTQVTAVVPVGATKGKVLLTINGQNAEGPVFTVTTSTTSKTAINPASMHREISMLPTGVITAYAK